MERTSTPSPARSSAAPARGVFRNGATVLLAIVVALLIAPAGRADKKDKALDLFWTHPDYARFAVDRIALLPAATYDASVPAAMLAEQAIGQALRSTGYRWVGATIVRDLLRAQPGGDSLLKLVQARLLNDPRPDSLLAPRICSLLHCDALLALRIDQWQQTTLEWNQSGKPSTTVQLHASLVDAKGALLWSASGSKTTEGPEQDANAGIRGVKDSGLDRTPLMNQGGPPSYREVVTTLATRWAPHFPPKPSAATAADSAAVAR